MIYNRPQDRPRTSNPRFDQRVYRGRPSQREVFGFFDSPVSYIIAVLMIGAGVVAWWWTTHDSLNNYTGFPESDGMAEVMLAAIIWTLFWVLWLLWVRYTARAYWRNFRSFVLWR